MCGLIGAFWVSPPLDAEARLSSGIEALKQRGPDDQGYEFYHLPDGTLALGHTRLSIIDLSSGGHQPMSSANGRYTIVYNGEIYNYRELREELKLLGYQFCTNSDTEVLLASWIIWGAKCLDSLRGMFAFVVYDHIAGTLTCVRDAFGIKPFYYRMDGDDFLFASEVPALLALMQQRPPFNLQRVYDYLLQGSYDDSAETFFAGVQQLLPGHILTMSLIDPGSTVIHRWWWPSIAERSDLSFDEAAAKMRSMFLDNIRLHLRSDVPLGAALSGGVDSSAVVCAIRHVSPDIPIHTFSYVARGTDVDEEYWADLVNAHVGAISHKVVVTPEELAEDMDDLICIQGEPFGSTSLYAQYRVFRLARDNGVTVTIDGQGADEMLAGYSGYPGPTMFSLIEKGKFIELFKFIGAWSRWPGRSYSQCLTALFSEVVPRRLRGFARRCAGRDPSPEWLNASFLKEHGVVSSTYKERFADARGRRLVAMLRQTLAGKGLNSLLRHGDRNSMRWSVESRVPFLTTDMAEFLLSLPEHYLISREGETKHILRAAMRGIVPDEILDRKDKVGFATPEQAWLNRLGNKVFDWLDAAEVLPFLDAANCKLEVKAMLEGQKPFNFQAWRLINFCRWTQLMDEKS